MPWVSTQQTQANIFHKGTRWVSNSDPVVSSQLQLFHYTKQERADSYRSRNDYIKNSAISVVAGAIYMRSLVPSRCYYIIYWRNKALTVLNTNGLSLFGSYFMILESNGDFYVQFASVSGLHSIDLRYTVRLIFIIAYLDEFKPSFSGGDIWKSSPKGSNSICLDHYSLTFLITDLHNILYCIFHFFSKIKSKNNQNKKIKNIKDLGLDLAPILICFGLS